MSWLVDLLAPPKCGACNSSGEPICAECAAALAVAPVLAAPPHADSFSSVFCYEGIGRELICSLKYENNRGLTRRYGVCLASAVAPAVSMDRGLRQVVTWVPTTQQRQVERGYDQAELLARSVAKALGLKAIGMLQKPSFEHQTGATRSVRSTVAFKLVRTPSPCVILIDDVRTTGASLSAASICLKEGGAKRVIAATLAVVP